MNERVMTREVREIMKAEEAPGLHGFRVECLKI